MLERGLQSRRYARGQGPPKSLVALLGVGLLGVFALAVVQFEGWTVVATLVFLAVAITGYWFEARSARTAAKEMALEVEEMLANSLNLNYEDCKTRARDVMDALHPNLEFVEDHERKVTHGWLFEFAIPTDDPENPWDYLIGCSSRIYVNRHTGKAEGTDPDQITSDWMGKAE